MKLTTPPDSGRSSRLLRAMASLALALPVLQVFTPSGLRQVVSNWVVYNDMAPNYSTPTADGWITAAGVSGYYSAFSTTLGSGGVLTNCARTVSFPVAELPPAVSARWPGASGCLPNGGRHRSVPSVPAGPTVPFRTPSSTVRPYNLFHGIVDLSNPGSLFGVGSGQSVFLTFTNLNPAMHYKFRGRSSGTASPSERTISAGRCARSPGPTPSSMRIRRHRHSYHRQRFGGIDLDQRPGGFQSGINTDGRVIGWDDIVPGADGTFTVVNQDYEGVTDVASSSAHVGLHLVRDHADRIWSQSPPRRSRPTRWPLSRPPS